MYLVTNGKLITRDEGGRGYYERGAVAFEGSLITEVGEEAALRAKYPDAEIIDAKGGVIMPALINAHTHIYSALARGLSIVGNNPTNFYHIHLCQRSRQKNQILHQRLRRYCLL